MSKLSDNYYLRKHHLRFDIVPTQNEIKERMKPQLAAVYFKTMSPQLKVLAGLEPPMKGRGTSWYAQPNLRIKGQMVKKPENKACMNIVNVHGIYDIGKKLGEKAQKRMKAEKGRVLKFNDEYWKAKIEAHAHKIFEKYSNDAQDQVIAQLRKGLTEYNYLFRTSLSQVEQLLADTASQIIKSKKEEIHQKKTIFFHALVKKQSLQLRDKYDNILENEKVRLKNKFIENLEVHRAQTFNQIHDLKIKKHLALESIRSYLTCQRLACQVYVSLKEREESHKEMELSKHKYQKKMKLSKEGITLQDFNIHRYQKKEKKRQEFITSWQMKVQRLLKYLQTFMAYCLANLPEQAEFFINLEKILLLQLSEILENPRAHSIIVEPEYMGPVPKPHPFYLLCDKGYKSEMNQDLCPKHYTSSATQLPVVVINKRFMYSACDNFEQLSERLVQFLYHHTDDDPHLEDHHIYHNDVPMKYTSSQQLTELKLESSLLQILQEELNLMPCLMCPVRKVTHCLCSMVPLSAHQSENLLLNLNFPIRQLPEEKKWQPNRVATRNKTPELPHIRDSKWESYLEVKTCKTIKTDLMEHLPPYMRKTSAYDVPELPNYERCSILSLKKLVDEAKKKTSTPAVNSVSLKTHDASTQYTDVEFEFLCNCFMNEEFECLVHGYDKFESS